MNKLLRHFLSGGSLAALQLCALGAVARAGTVTGSHTKVTIAANTTQEVVATGAAISGNVTNNATIGPHNPAFLVQTGASIIGSLVNAAPGIIQSGRTGIAVATGASVGGISNLGKILVAATNASGTVRGVEYGGSGAATLALTNSGTISVGVTGTFSTNTMRGVALGVNESVNAAGHSPSLTITNSGGISLKADQVNEGGGSDKIAVAEVEDQLHQYADSTSSATLKITNSGVLNATATAFANAHNSYSALATAAAAKIMAQTDFASAVHAGSIASLTISNSAAVTVAVKATANAASSEHAAAHAHIVSAVKQFAGDTADSELSITNSGALTLTANAKAVSGSSSRAVATAEIEQVMRQSAYVSSGSAAQAAKANLTITNSGVISLMAKATGTGSGATNVDGIVATVFKQAAHDNGVIGETITNTNSGTLLLTAQANALATASGGAAFAQAVVDEVFHQRAADHGVPAAESIVTQSITNSAAVTLNAAAKAVRHLATTSNAHAVVFVGEVLAQDDSEVITSSQTIINSGALTLAAKATAIATDLHAAGQHYRATAGANISRVAYQDASGTTVASRQAHSVISQSITNSATLNLSAVAKATMLGHGVGGTTVNRASAQAAVHEVMFQSAERATSITQAIGNSGAIQINASALANGTATEGVVHANASARKIFFQGASGFEDKSIIAQTITNSGALSIALVSKAKAVGSDMAVHDQFQDVSELFDQAARDAKTITQTVNNTGSLTVAITAQATAGSHFVGQGLGGHAFDVFVQDASADTSDSHASVTQSLSNSGTLKFTINALAKRGGAGTGGNSASAKAFAQDVFVQEADNAATIKQTLSNTGSLTISLAATATAPQRNHKAYAGSDFAEFSNLIFQSADPHETNNSATQSITNSGALSLTANFKAKASQIFASTTDAQVALTARKLFFQHADHAGSITQSLTNSGGITLKMNGTATGIATGTHLTANNAGARARVIAGEFFAQSVSHVTEPPAAAVSQTITNSGALAITLNANANGQRSAGATRAGAVASAKLLSALFFQHGSADNASIGSVNQSISNSGSITINNTATAATKGNHDIAKASMTWIFDQDATDGGDVTQAVTNSAPVLVNLTATDKGALTSAVATVTVHGLGWNQDASDSHSVVQNASNSNTGSFTVNGTASATGAELAKARVEGTQDEFEQEAESIVSAITQTAVNNAAIKLTYAAAATAGTNAEATAKQEDVLFLQDGFNSSGASVSQSLTNAGSITLSLTAKAKGKATSTHVTQAHALASVEEKLWGQTADGAGKPVTQTITNSATVSVALFAQATAKQAAATARAESKLFADQAASGDNLGTITQTFSNSGTLAVAATALANGKRRGFAEARINIAIEQFEDDYTNANQTVTNSGTINVTLTAKASGATAAATGTNRAEANFDELVRQQTEDNFITTAAGIGANQTITNSGTIAIKQVATATGARQVTAQAEFTHVFAQLNTGEEGSAINQKFTNSGTITVSQSAKAKTSGANFTEQANARGTGLKQLVEQSGERGQIANLSITNSGAFTIARAATATGAHLVDAFAEGGMFSQRVEGQSSAGAAVGATLSINNSGTVTISGNSAKATGKRQVEAEAGAYFAEQETEDNVRSSLSIVNSGKVTLAAAATAVATNSAKEARADVQGMEQFASSGPDNLPVGTAALSMSNSGTLTVTSTGKASAGNRANVSVTATGAEQFTRQNGAISFNNSGTISVSAAATLATVTPGAGTTAPRNAPSIDRAKAAGYRFLAQGTSGVSVTNSGTTAFTPRVPAPTVSVSNSGSMSVSASVAGGTLLHARASALAVGMNLAATSKVSAKDLTTSATGNYTSRTKRFTGETIRGAVSNSGALTVGATGAGVLAHAQGIVVEANVQAESVTNAAGGAINVTASGATALAAGIDLHNIFRTSRSVENRNHHTTHFQTNDVSHTINGVGPSASVTGNVSNSGTITVSATGTVSEKADGIAINAAVVSDTILNAGSITVSATGPGAVANGIRLYASKTATTFTSTYHHFNVATAHGATTSQVFGTHRAHTHIGNVTLSGTINNTGTLSVTATAAGSAATANGIAVDGGTLTGASVLNAGTINATGSGATATVNDELLTGSGAVTVSDKGGKLNATATSTTGAAVANGVNLTDATLAGSSFTGGGGTIAANGANGATANGWLISGAGKITFAGSGGTFNVSANATKGTATANGINIQGGALTGSTISNGDSVSVSATGIAGTTPVANALLVVGTGAFAVNNVGGTLSSLVTVAGSASYGTAINVNGASAATIGLQGGTIAGNIVEASGGNAITVSAGNTLFNGGINPSKALLGSLTIASTGTLTLGSNGGLGAGNVWTGSFTQPGTLALNATSDTTVEGSIHATTATLSGPVVLNLNVTTGAAFGLSTTYKVVFTTGALTGTWSSVTVTDPTFFTAAGVYSANEADITLTRAALGALPGLTSNEQQVGNALEKIYDAGGSTGPLGSLTNALFALTPAQYADALQQLSGETIGDLNATDAADLQNIMDAIIGHLGDDTGSAGAGGTAFNGLPGVHEAQEADFGPARAWGGVYATSGHVSATLSGPAYRTHGAGMIGGADFAVNDSVMLGAAVGYDNGTLRTANDLGGYHGVQISGYGRFTDPGNQYYVLGDVSYSSYGNNEHRTITIPGLAPATVSGKFDSSTIALYGETGYHWSNAGLPVNLTPYAAISYLNASADPFTETGSFVAPLQVASSSSTSTLSYLGMWFSQTWMSNNTAITPSVKAAWEHDFTTNAWTVNAAFAPVASVASFGINGSALSRDAAFVDAGVTISSGDNLDFKLDYTGRLSSDRDENTIMGRLVFKF